MKALLYPFHQIMTTERVPKAFKEVFIVVLYKKNICLAYSNNHPTSLLSHLCKVFITIVAKRINSYLYVPSLLLELFTNMVEEP